MNSKHANLFLFGLPAPTRQWVVALCNARKGYLARPLADLLPARVLAPPLSVSTAVAAAAADRVGRRVAGDQSGSCAGKTLDDLRSSGRAYDLPK
jgi:hypothetical protein